MKEQEFEKGLKEMNFQDGLITQVYYWVDDKGNVTLDEEGMTEEFEGKIGELKKLLEYYKN